MLVATVLLVLGLLAEGGLGLVYASIACSVAAGIALVVATVLRRPSEEGAPAPAAGWSGQQAAATTGSAPAPAPETTAPVPVVPAAAPAYTSARQPVLAGVGASGGGDDDFFPIEDYDDLKVAEILPLIPELYPDELDMVEARERETKGRVTVLDRIDEVRRGAGAAPATAEVPAAGDDFFPIEDYDELRVAEILPLLPQLYPDEMDLVERHERAGKGRVSIINRLAELRQGGEAEAPAVDDDAGMDAGDIDGDEDFFPIEDYDELTVGEILPLLPELYEDELDVVEERERATKNRAAIVERLAELRGEPAAPGVAEDGDWPVPDEGWDGTGGEPAPTGAGETEPAGGTEDADIFPIENYDGLRVPEIRKVLPQLTEEELEEVRDAERRGSNRITVLTAIDRELGVESAPVRKAPAKRSTKRTSAAKKAATKTSPARKATTKAAAKKATTKKRSAKKSAARR
ncbi:MAG TPA: hypothetical protein VNT56_11720 [Acidimicrobiales bacterium]|nr:hypothetical protein [Acidimicrobiales bacterium]